MLVAIALLASIGCGSRSQDANPGPPPERPPILTEQGVPTAPVPAEGGVGTEGGEVSSGDGRLTVIVPPGALASSGTISVQPITNTAIGGVGEAFRLRPEGVTFQKPVTLVFRVPEDQIAGVGIQGLGVAYQDASRFWLPVRDVRRDAAANTVTVEADHFSDWALVWVDGTPGLYGPFTLSQTLGAVPFTASGTATLFYQGESDTTALYVLTGSIVPTIDPAAATCTPDVVPADRTLVPGYAEIRKDGSRFRWAINARWDLTCTAMSPPEQFMASVFDTLGLNVALGGCARSYAELPTIGTGGTQGTYTIECGANGRATATWDFAPCLPGVACTDPALNPCVLGATSCGTGMPVCQETTSPVADGTACGTDLLEQCSSGTCTCVEGPNPACTPVDACHTAGVSCDPIAGPACTQTALTGDGCVPQDACHTAAWSCDPVAGPTCTQSPVQTGQSCPPIDDCHTGTVTCDPVNGTQCTQTALTGTQCDGGGLPGTCSDGVCVPN